MKQEDEFDDQGSEPKLLYRAESAMEAALYVHALESAGIRSQSAGGAGSISFGDLGADALRVDVYVPEKELETGRRIIEECQAHGLDEVDSQPTAWVCASCAEVSEGNFECCWKCGAARSDRGS